MFKCSFDDWAASSALPFGDCCPASDIVDEMGGGWMMSGQMRGFKVAQRVSSKDLSLAGDGTGGLSDEVTEEEM